MMTPASRRLAVDVVLLPPASVTRRAIAVSRRLDSEFRLGPRALPHVTVAMACVEAESVPTVVAALRDLVRRRPSFEVTLWRAVAVAGSSHATSWYEARRTRELMGLHRDVLRLLAPHRRTRVDPSDFVRRRGERISASSIRWVSRFVEDASGPRYRPHVTLGYGEPPDDPALPLRFPARRLALCWLGNHCTCAKVLAEVTLPARATTDARTARHTRRRPPATGRGRR